MENLERSCHIVDKMISIVLPNDTNISLISEDMLPFLEHGETVTCRGVTLLNQEFIDPTAAAENLVDTT